MIHLDTSVLVDLLREARRGAAGPASLFLRKWSAEELATPVHAVCELWAGAAASRKPTEERGRVEILLGTLPVVYPDARFARTYADLWVSLERAGRRIGTMDLLIATAAVAANARLATRNVQHFGRILGLELLTY